ncbi:hypothetical protein, partial [Streptomyces toxytricini]|uniref:hypothetical protein n=1 Tax=Streptomyces toxytricini TaxID=67369 RepID=UPI0034210FC3
RRRPAGGADPAAASAPRPAAGLPGREGAVIGTLCALLLLLGTVSSSMADRYMPAQDGTYRILPYVSHTIRQQDGECPRFAPKGECSEDGDQTWLTYVR